MRTYRFRVTKNLGEGFGPIDFEIAICARGDRAAQAIAAQLGLSLGLLLVGPV